MPLDPVLIAYTAVRSAKSGRTRWTRIGMAFPHETGAGLTVVLESIPLDGIVILLERDDDDDKRLAAMGPEMRPTAASRPPRDNKRGPGKPSR